MHDRADRAAAKMISDRIGRPCSVDHRLTTKRYVDRDDDQAGGDAQRVVLDAAGLDLADARGRPPGSARRCR